MKKAIYSFQHLVGLFLLHLFIPINSTDAQLTPQTIHSSITAPYGTMAVDLDSDGDLDAISISRQFSDLYWYENDGTTNPSFLVNLISLNFSTSESLATADMNGDGDIDIVVGSAGSISIVDNDGSQNFSKQTLSTGLNDINYIHLEDVNGDGHIDILSARAFAGDDVILYLNDGANVPSFSTIVIANNFNGAASVSSADFDNDGDMDVVATARFANDVAWWENDGMPTPSFTMHTIDYSLSAATNATVADVDGDGDIDILATGIFANDLVWYKNDGATNPSFSKQFIDNNFGYPNSIETGDLDNDGDIDVVSSSIDNNIDKIAYFLNDGSQNFTKTVLPLPFPDANTAHIVDLNNDGQVDILSASTQPQGVTWWKNDGISSCDPPEAKCKSHIATLNNNLEVTISASDIDNGSLADCGLQSLELNITDFECNDLGDNLVTLTIMDNAGNSDYCTTIVTVLDDILPYSICPPSINNRDTDFGTCSYQVQGNEFDITYAMPNCGLQLEVNDFNGSNTLAGATFPVGTTTVTWTVTAADGHNMSCSFDITVTDNETPNITCNSAIGVSLNSNGTVTITTQDIEEGISTDNCGIQNKSLNISTFDCNDLGNNQVTLTVTDVNGNFNDCTATVTVEDKSPPVFTSSCPADIEVCEDEYVTWIPPNTSDNCNYQVLLSHNMGIFNVGTTTVTYEAIDDSGNDAACSFDVTVRPKPNVTITQNSLPDFCQGLTILEADVSNPSPFLNYIWSNGATERTTTIYNNATYNVSVTNEFLCEGTATSNVNITAHQVLSGYVMIADDEFEAKETTVNGGGIGVLDGDGEAEIDDNSVINTFVKADEVEVEGGSYAAQVIQSKANITLPPFRNSTNTNNNNITVNKNQTKTLTGSSYGNIKLKKNATLYFDNPEIFVKKIETDEGSTIDFLQPTEVMVKGELKIDKENDFNPSGEAVVLYLKKKLEVKEESDVTGAIYTKKKIETKGKSNSKPTNMTGLFIALQEIKSDKYTIWNASENCFMPPGGSQNMIVNDLFTFQAINNQTEVDLMWVSNLDEEIESYILEKSADGIHFEPIKEAISKGNDREVQVYKNSDMAPLTGDNFYRIKLKYRDEGIGYSDIQLVNFGALETFDIFPNPASDEVNIHLEKFLDKKIDLVIFNQLGQEVSRTHFENLDNPWYQIDLEGSEFRDGLYMISVIHNGKAQSKRLVITKF